MRTLAALLACGLLIAPGASQAGDAREAERARYREYRQARAAGQHASAERVARTLSAYPLYPYVRYDGLRARLPQLPAAEIEGFLADHGGSFIGERLRSEWLRELAGRARWDLFRRDYREQEAIELQCHALTARLSGGADVTASARALWLSGDSRPPACDPPFAWLARRGLLTDDLIWARMELAFAAGRSGLAAHLARRLASAPLRVLAGRWAQAHADPAAALVASEPAPDPRERAVLLHALARLAARDVEAARAAWRTLAARVTFDEDDLGRAAAIVALAAARSGHPDRIELLDRVPAANVDPEIERYRLREGIAAAAWPELSRWTAQPAQVADEALRSRYWHARALDANGSRAQAQAAWRSLAGERDYYGFLAADRGGAEYAFNEVAVAARADETRAFLARPALLRVAEFRALGLEFEARREWNFELAGAAVRDVQIAAYVAAQWGWHERAIAALGQVESYDDLVLRFPLAHLDLAEEYAARRRLTPAMLLAFVRNESAFAVQARSPAGALGLMQLMPATARETAARIGLRYPGPPALFEPRTNIALGSAYLAQLLARYDGHMVLAAAAYNAGPQRVRQWLGRHCLEADRWIEAIPFSETRSYVRRALFYIAVYERRLGATVGRLAASMPAVPARDSAPSTECEP